MIVTADLPPDLQSWATGLRRAHFPPERNYLDAHVTLFHALPPSCESELLDLLARIASEHAPPPARMEGIMSLGRGTALKLSSPAMLDLRDRIADHFHGMLTSQDEHRLRLHVTIQNKVSPSEAKRLQVELAPQMSPRSFSFRGLSCHYYRAGPWEKVKSFAFRGRNAA